MFQVLRCKRFIRSGEDKFSGDGLTKVVIHKRKGDKGSTLSCATLDDYTEPTRSQRRTRRVVRPVEREPVVVYDTSKGEQETEPRHVPTRVAVDEAGRERTLGERKL